MIAKKIIFPRANEAELVDVEVQEPASGEVLVKTVISSVSPGTERANIIGNDSVAGAKAPEVKFPRSVGYSSAGEVVAVGEGVQEFSVGDRVIVFHGKHISYNLAKTKNVVKIDDDVSYEDAAAVFISTFPLAAVRKTGLEIGESMLVMGLGLLGQFAVRLARAAGAAPLIAADPNEKRRAIALAGGADIALDPLAPDFAEKVKALTKGGVNTAIEVTGVGAGLDETLDCMAPMGRVALLGCTRDKNFTIDYYRKVHFPGITLIGAHTNARPQTESYPHHFTHRDDIGAVLKLIAGKRLSFAGLEQNSHAPTECAEVYRDLIQNKDFPLLTQFDWRLLNSPQSSAANSKAVLV